jgi:hypothetical protein
MVCVRPVRVVPNALSVGAVFDREQAATVPDRLVSAACAAISAAAKALATAIPPTISEILRLKLENNVFPFLDESRPPQRHPLEAQTRRVVSRWQLG